MNRIDLGNYSPHYKINFEHIFDVPFVVTSFCLFVHLPLECFVKYILCLCYVITHFFKCQQFVLKFVVIYNFYYIFCQTVVL